MEANWVDSSWCLPNKYTLSAPTIAPIEYFVGPTDPMTVPMGDFSLNEICSDIDWVFGDTSVTLTDDAIVTIDAVNNNLVIYTADIQWLGVHTITVTGTLPNFQSISVDF